MFQVQELMSYTDKDKATNQKSEDNRNSPATAENKDDNSDSILRQSEDDFGMSAEEEDWKKEPVTDKY